MKGFLLDENLPRTLVVRTSFPIVHTEMLGDSPSDDSVWRYARENDLVIVSKDADFSDRILTTYPPPWVVHLRFGNMRLATFRAMMEKVWPAIEALLPARKLICVYTDRIESFSD